jgi:hypothetical protein
LAKKTLAAAAKIAVEASRINGPCVHLCCGTAGSSLRRESIVRYFTDEAETTMLIILLLGIILFL